METRFFPVEVPPGGDDARFTFGLVLDVAEVLRRHQFPDASASAPDFVELQQALFRFLYRS